MRRAVLLFDIDGTLLTFRGPSPGPGRTAMARASIELFGADHTAGLRFAGGTDLSLARAIATAARATAMEEARRALLARYTVFLEEELSRRPYVPLGDVHGTVTWAKGAGHRVALATGNLREGAAIKLRSAGLHALFPLEGGGFGGDHEARADFVRAAIDAAAGHGEPIVVGDTDADVAAARATGARVIGVATSPAAREELAGADALAEDCGASLRAAIEALLLRSPAP